jgi:branched-chain amino acid aminotransferase
LKKENSTRNEKGLSINIYPEARKAIDTFSNLKSNNYLPYFMAALYAKQHRLNDCLILNTNGNVCDATIANIFIMKGNIVSTPPLSEGCVAGVMRRYLLEHLSSVGYKPAEVPITIPDIRNADEVLLSNAIYGIRWAEQFDDITFKPSASLEIDNFLIKNLH